MLLEQARGFYGFKSFLKDNKLYYKSVKNIFIRKK